MSDIIWHSLSVKETFDLLKSNVLGLSKVEAEKLKVKYGLNELPKKKKLTKLDIVISQFKSALVYILLLAALVSFFLGENIDMAVIIAAVVINVLVGYIQENKAQNALSKLNEMVIPQVKVFRDGIEEEIEAKNLVPGDVIVVEAGNRVTADARLFEEIELEVSESALTGESASVDKEIESLNKGKVLAERINMLYSGTLISKGKGKAVVVATGSKTQIGQIAGMLRDIKEDPTPLQKRLDKFSKSLSIFILLLSLAILILGVASGNGFILMFNTAVAVAVAAIPEGLLVAVTVILALGMQSILKKQALVRKLVSAETLGSTTVICTDKTGTLTEGKMRVTEIVTDSSALDVLQCSINNQSTILEEAHLSFKIGMLCNDAVIQNEDDSLKENQVLGSSTESALLFAGAQIGLKQKKLNQQYKRLDEIVFSSERKFMATLHEQYCDKKNVIYFKGAPEKIIESASYFHQGDKIVKIYKDKRDEIVKKYECLSKKGLRVLAVGYKHVDSDIIKLEKNEAVLEDLVWTGFMGIKDPLRQDVKTTLIATKKAGIKTVMITGDNSITARTIAKELGMEVKDENILEGSEMLKLDDEQLIQKVRQIKVYARVTPRDKLRIVEAWQKRGEVVAMTGDGVNDAPALKRADVGIALGSGSDVAKETADLVLLNNGYSVIISAIEQGRVIYDNIKKVILYLLSDSFSEILLIFGSLMLGMPLPLLPTQILWINLITDGFPSMALTVEPEENEVMEEAPQERDKPILDFERRLLIGIISFVTAATTLGIFYYYWKVIGDLALARTVAFATLGIDSLLYVFSCRSLRHSIFHSHFFSNKYLLLSVITGAWLQLIAIYTPFFQKFLKTVNLGLNEWLIIGAVNVIVILVIELVKWIFIARHKK